MREATIETKTRWNYSCIVWPEISKFVARRRRLLCMKLNYSKYFDCVEQSTSLISRQIQITIGFDIHRRFESQKPHSWQKLIIWFKSNYGSTTHSSAYINAGYLIISEAQLLVYNQKDREREREKGRASSVTREHFHTMPSHVSFLIVNITRFRQWSVCCLSSS